MRIIRFVVLVLLSISLKTNASIDQQGYFAEPKVNSHIYKSPFGHSLLISNVVKAIKYGDVNALRKNMEAGFNPFEVDVNGFSFVDAFISLSHNEKNDFGLELSDLVRELITTGRGRVEEAIQAALKNDADSFEEILLKQNFYYYTPVMSGSLLGHEVAKSSCTRCMSLLIEFNYNINIPSLNGKVLQK